MAKKSKTQRAKASARRAEKRELLDEQIREDADSPEGSTEPEPAGKATAKAEPVLAKTEKKPAKKEPGRIASFFQGVRSELRRVTWPTRTDVIRWSGVVVGALLFFGVFVFVLDNIFPQLLVLLDSLNSAGA